MIKGRTFPSLYDDDDAEPPMQYPVERRFALNGREKTYYESKAECGAAERKSCALNVDLRMMPPANQPTESG